ncbi:helix-turn-helix transcriptional regulator [Nitrincola sp.]|uniref:helix-turn-helix transcriptional regulator n=1 Tax=Nitrincola sp. TaxID=1926584 RepID=UPI003A94B783
MKNHNPPAFLSDKDLADRWSVHRATPWEWARQGRIPAPVKLSGRCTRWKLAEIEAWEEKQGGVH